MVLNYALGGIDGRMELRVRVNIDPVEVDAPLVGAVVAPLDTVRVQERDQLEDVLLPELTGSLILATQDEVKESIEDKTGWCLARMNTTAQEINLEDEVIKNTWFLILNCNSLA